MLWPANERNLLFGSQILRFAQDDKIRGRHGLLSLQSIENPHPGVALRSEQAGHLQTSQEIYASGELDRQAPVSEMETGQPEGGRMVPMHVEMYNLDAVNLIKHRN